MKNWATSIWRKATNKHAMFDRAVARAGTIDPFYGRVPIQLGDAAAAHPDSNEWWTGIDHDFFGG
jgi:hypothetical protein